MRIPKIHTRPGTRDQHWFRKYYRHPDPSLNAQRPSIVVNVVGSKDEARAVATAVTKRHALRAYDPYNPWTLLQDQYHGPTMWVDSDEKGSIQIIRHSTTSGTLFSSAVGAFLDSQRFQKYSTSWQANIKSALNKHLLPAFGELHTGGITTASIDDFTVSLLEVGYDPRTPQVCVDVLRYVFAHAKSNGLTPEDVALAASRPEADGDIAGKAMSLEEAKAYLAVLGTDALDRALRASIYLGARPSELLALTVKHVEVREADWAFKIEKALEPRYSGGHLVLKNPKSKRGKRTIHVPAGPGIAIVGDVVSGFLFPRPDGNPETVKALRDRHYETLEKAGLDRYRLYDNRHYHNTMLLSIPDVSPHSTSRRAGHSSTATTERVYGHQNTEADIKAGRAFHDIHNA